MIGVKVRGFLAERFFVTDGNIAAYVNKNAAILICRPHRNIGGCGDRHRAREAPVPIERYQAKKLQA